MNPLDLVRDQKNLRLKCWIVAQVLLPLLFAFIVWPLSYAFFLVPDSFEVTFRTGDLVLIGAMLLLGVLVDLYYEQRANDKLRNPENRQLASKLDTHYFVSLFLSITLLFVYVWLKASTMVEGKKVIVQMSGLQLSTHAISSFAVGFVGVVWAIFITHKVMEYLLAAERAALNTQNGSS